MKNKFSINKKNYFFCFHLLLILFLDYFCHCIDRCEFFKDRYKISNFSKIIVPARVHNFHLLFCSYSTVILGNNFFNSAISLRTGRIFANLKPSGKNPVLNERFVKFVKKMLTQNEFLRKKRF